MLSSIDWRRCTCGSLRGTKRERDKNIQFIRSFHNSCIDASATGEFNFHLTWLGFARAKRGNALHPTSIVKWPGWSRRFHGENSDRAFDHNASTIIGHDPNTSCTDSNFLADSCRVRGSVETWANQIRSDSVGSNDERSGSNRPARVLGQRWKHRILNN